MFLVFFCENQSAKALFLVFFCENQSAKTVFFAFLPAAAAAADNQKKPIELMRDRTVIILLFVFGTYALCFVPITVLNLAFYISQERHLFIFKHSSVGQGRLYKALQMLYYLNFVLTTFVYSILR